MNASALERRFCYTAGGILAITGLAKAFSAIGPARALDVADPIFGIPFRHLMLLVGLAELSIALLAFMTNKSQFSLLAIAWLSTSFLLYRIGLWWMGWHRPCGCLGNLVDILHISPQTADSITKLSLSYLLVGSYWLAARTCIWDWADRPSSVMEK